MSDITQLNNIKLHNIDDLKLITTQGINERRIAAITAEQLIEQAIINYQRKHCERTTKNIITKYRQQMQNVADQELNFAKQALAAGKNQEDVLQEFSRRLINKIMHQPTMHLKQSKIKELLADDQ
jgi:glutamyl-tRNA reductase